MLFIDVSKHMAFWHLSHCHAMKAQVSFGKMGTHSSEPLLLACTYYRSRWRLWPNFMVLVMFENMTTKAWKITQHAKKFKQALANVISTVKPVLSNHLKRRPKIGFQYQLSLNAGQKYCRMLQGEHSAILLTFIKLPFVIKIFILSIFEWPLKTSFTVPKSHVLAHKIIVHGWVI